MSRSKKGAKGPGYDYQSARPGTAPHCAASGPEVKRRTHRLERLQAKKAEKRQDE